MKSRTLYFGVFAFLLCISAITAQNCRMYRVLIRRGQRVCQRMCTPVRGRPEIRCYTSRFGENISLCPPSCCRMGGSCSRLLYV